MVVLLELRELTELQVLLVVQEPQEVEARLGPLVQARLGVLELRVVEGVLELVEVQVVQAPRGVQALPALVGVLVVEGPQERVVLLGLEVLQDLAAVREVAVTQEVAGPRGV